MFLFTEARLRKKWKYLRDQFSVESGKIQQSRSGDGTDTTTKWPYFQSLLYLKDVIKPRTSIGNINKTSRDLSPKYNDDDDNQSFLMEHEDNLPTASSSIEHGDNNQPLPSEHYSSVLSRKRRAMMSASSNDTLLDIEREMLQFLQEKNKKNLENDKADEHVLFFKSLLPHVRKIPHHRLLSFRSRVQELAEQYAYETS